MKNESEWQPIETAPKDRTIVSLWSVSDGLITTQWWWGDGWTDNLNDFTHWRREISPNGEFEYTKPAELMAEKTL